MTIKGDDSEIVAHSKTSYAAEQEPEIPVAFASVLDEKPAATAPGYVAGDPVYEPTATISPQTSTAAATAASATTPTTTNMVVHGDTVPVGNNKPPTSTTRPVPPNAPPGGNWVRFKYTGNQTWAIVGGVGCALFWCCAFVLAPCALFGLFCPCDEKEGYMSPNGVIYDERGRALGDRRRNKFVVIAKA